MWLDLKLTNPNWPNSRSQSNTIESQITFMALMLDRRRRPRRWRNRQNLARKWTRSINGTMESFPTWSTSTSVIIEAHYWKSLEIVQKYWTFFVFEQQQQQIEAEKQKLKIKRAIDKITNRTDGCIKFIDYEKDKLRSQRKAWLHFVNEDGCWSWVWNIIHSTYSEFVLIYYQL